MNKSLHTDSYASTFRVHIFLVLSIVLLLSFKLAISFTHKIAWDEFYFLSKFYTYQRGELSEPFQNFHVHLLGWVPWVSNNEVIQIISARCALFALLVASAVLLYGIARHFIDRTGALFAVFCWVAFSHIIRHGASLRYDSFCAFLFLLSCYGLLHTRRQRIWTAVAGIAMGLSLLISLKAAIHVVTLEVLLASMYLTGRRKPDLFRKTMGFTSLTALAFVIGFAIHRRALAAPLTPEGESFVRHASSKAIVLGELFPQIGYFAESLRNNMVIWWLLGVGIFYACRECRQIGRWKNLQLLAFLVPLCSLLLYRNAFPYYYTFIMAPAVLFCGFLPQRLLHAWRTTDSRAALGGFLALWLVIAAGAAVHFSTAYRQDNRSQRTLFSAIHSMFPTPVPYIDGCYAVGSFPHVGFFMSTWGFENYLAAGTPIFRGLLTEQQPLFMLADTPHLDFAFPRDHPFFAINHDFFESDRQVLHDNFVPAWGMLWLPGKTLHFASPGTHARFEILIPGPYRLKGAGSLVIDGHEIRPGQALELTAGWHEARSEENTQPAVLRWDGVILPSTPPPATATFYGF